MHRAFPRFSPLVQEARWSLGNPPAKARTTLEARHEYGTLYTARSGPDIRDFKLTRGYLHRNTDRSPSISLQNFSSTKRPLIWNGRRNVHLTKRLWNTCERSFSTLTPIALGSPKNPPNQQSTIRGKQESNTSTLSNDQKRCFSGLSKTLRPGGDLGGNVGVRGFSRITEQLLERLRAADLPEARLDQEFYLPDLNRVLSFQSFEDHLFEILSNDRGKVPISRFLAGLRSVGLQQSDPRLRESMQRIRALQSVMADMDGKEVMLDKDAFKECIQDNIMLIKRAFTADFIIPEFIKFTSMIDQIYWNCRTNTGGRVASYIPQLSRYSADYWGVSMCTIDGQRYSAGDVGVPFSLQSTAKPLTYALALHELGSDVVHDYVGQEPSGEVFNMIKLDQNNKPHNPMINAGAIVIASLVKNNLRLADRFDYVSQQYKRLAGGEYLGFNNAIFLSERETADRNFALGYYMKENKCFPDGVNLMETMDFYFQLCSTEVTCDAGAVMAATLANGGICPLTGEQVLSGEAVRNTLALMHSCGMYDYSGQFAFKVGLPAKSGVSGVILLVVPNVMGMCLWSPPLDQCGNSVRGIQFCEELVGQFNFHHYDNLLHTRRKVDPRRRRMDKAGQEVVSLLFGAYNGDLSALTRMALSGVDMRIADYDGRTALHLAAAEGHLEVVRFLLEKCHVPLYPADRWGHTPLDDAVRFKRLPIQRYLEEYAERHAHTHGFPPPGEAEPGAQGEREP